VARSDRLITQTKGQRKSVVEKKELGLKELIDLPLTDILVHISDLLVILNNTIGNFVNIYFVVANFFPDCPFIIKLVF
jgi:hypothetical protein